MGPATLGRGGPEASGPGWSVGIRREAAMA
jgi:hypothetical protein